MRVIDAALHREQVNPALVIRRGEEHDALGETTGVPEPVLIEHRVVHEHAPGSVCGHADVKFETRWAAGNLLDDAAHPAGLTRQKDLTRVTRVDAGSVVAGIGQFRTAQSAHGFSAS